MLVFQQKRINAIIITARHEQQLQEETIQV